jgi:coenzyme F420-reducing hydrogenase gamma subunit
LALLNLGEPLLELAQRVELVHFAEAGPMDPEAQVDIALIEGSISTPDDLQRVQRIRDRSRYVITIGACATAGGLQALRNLARHGEDWPGAIYAQPQYIDSLETVTPIARHIQVDHELWGCPVNSAQVLGAIRDLLLGVTPVDDCDTVCLECKRRNYTCVQVTGNGPCLGPVTRNGCGALCPAQARGCYGCYGPADNANTASLGAHFSAGGMSARDVRQRFHFINSNAPVFLEAGNNWRDDGDD